MGRAPRAGAGAGPDGLPSARYRSGTGSAVQTGMGPVWAPRHRPGMRSPLCPDRAQGPHSPPVPVPSRDSIPAIRLLRYRPGRAPRCLATPASACTRPVSPRFPLPVQGGPRGAQGFPRDPQSPDSAPVEEHGGSSQGRAGLGAPSRGCGGLRQRCSGGVSTHRAPGRRRGAVRPNLIPRRRFSPTPLVPGSRR